MSPGMPSDQKLSVEDGQGLQLLAHSSFSVGYECEERNAERIAGSLP